LRLISINPTFFYRPFPYGTLAEIFDKETFGKLVATFPPLDLFRRMDALGKKHSLSEINNRKQYFRYLEECPEWNNVYREVKSDGFLIRVLSALKDHHIDPMIDDYMPYRYSGLKGTLRQIRSLNFPRFARARFEFASMQANGGCILPHTDSTTKVITLVMNMNFEDEWDESYGGETVICEPIDESLTYNLANEYFTFDQIREVARIPMRDCGGSIFIKTFNSWHCVFPMVGPPDAMRNTITINIEVL